VSEQAMKTPDHELIEAAGRFLIEHARHDIEHQGVFASCKTCYHGIHHPAHPPAPETEAERLRREAHEALDRYLNETVQAEKHADWLTRAREKGLALRRFENGVCAFLAAARAKEGRNEP
jgi:hypothetical protein